jgi:UPF0716 protein FxsA
LRTLAIALLLFVLWVYAEISLLLLVAEETNLLIALLLMVFAGFLGVVIARAQGWQLLLRVRREMAQGEVPVDSLLNGLVLFLAGVLLLLPGFLSDILGIVLLLPPVRSAAATMIRRRFQRRVKAGRAWIGRSPRRSTRGGDVVDSYAVPEDEPRLLDEREPKPKPENRDGIG